MLLFSSWYFNVGVTGRYRVLINVDVGDKKSLWDANIYGCVACFFVSVTSFQEVLGTARLKYKSMCMLSDITWRRTCWAGCILSWAKAWYNGMFMSFHLLHPLCLRSFLGLYVHAWSALHCWHGRLEFKAPRVTAGDSRDWETAIGAGGSEVAEGSIEQSRHVTTADCSAAATFLVRPKAPPPKPRFALLHSNAEYMLHRASQRSLCLYPMFFIVFCMFLHLAE